MSVVLSRVAPASRSVVSVGRGSFTRWHQLFVEHRCRPPSHRCFASVHARPVVPESPIPSPTLSSSGLAPTVPPRPTPSSTSPASTSALSHPHSTASPQSIAHFNVTAADFPPRHLLHTLDTLPSLSEPQPPSLHYQTLPPLPLPFPPPLLPASLHKPRVTVALSGGVDSSVSAFLLREAGYDVRCVYMHNWDERDETGECSASEDRADAEAVCRHLSLPIECVEFVREYWVDVFERMVDGYRNGSTPNPDVWCNREIKFGRLLQWLRLKGNEGQQNGGVLLATGHYARTQRVYDATSQADGRSMSSGEQMPYVETDMRRIVDDSLAYAESLQSPATVTGLTSTFAQSQQQHRSTVPTDLPLSLGLPLRSARLLTARDPRKDQTYFLSLIPAAALPHLLFPLGGLPKATTRSLAHHAGLPTATKADSMGICMIGRRPFNSWLADYIDVREGRFIDEQGREIGRHRGAEVWTVGQKARVGGQKRRWYVAAKGDEALRDVAGSRPGDVLVVDDRLHPRLLYDDVVIGDVNWLEGEPAAVASHGAVELYCRLRSTELLRRCEVRRVAGGPATAGVEYSVRFLDMPHHLISPGQTCVFYLAEYCLGGGPIVRSGLSYHQQSKRLSFAES